jgi:hypothetical protein
MINEIASDTNKDLVDALSFFLAASEFTVERRLSLAIRGSRVQGSPFRVSLPNFFQADHIPGCTIARILRARRPALLWLSWVQRVLGSEVQNRLSKILCKKLTLKQSPVTMPGQANPER